MKLNLAWNEKTSWVACFDILGFKELVKFEESSESKLKYIMEDYEGILDGVKESLSFGEGDVTCCWISDTFIFYTQSADRDSFIAIKDVATQFIEACITRLVPIRGAITAGHIVFTSDHRVFMGSGFIEAFEYAEGQDWIGLLLTKNALSKINQFELGVNLDSFVTSAEIPMKKGFINNSIMAYRFQSGSQSFENKNIFPLLTIKENSPEQHHGKYDRTVSFIRSHHRETS